MWLFLFGLSARQLPPGLMVLHEPMVVSGDGVELTGHPKGTVLRMAPGFKGAAMVLAQGKNIKLSGLSIEGGRSANDPRIGLPPSHLTFAEFHQRTGILADRVDGLEITNVVLRQMPGMAIIVRGGRNARLTRLHLEDNGGLNAKGRNNATGGILFEDGAELFFVDSCVFVRIRGNALWTHSRYKSPRNTSGGFLRNHFEYVGRDAIQIGHANKVSVQQNIGKYIGYPQEIVDAEGGGTPVAIDTAGNVDESDYTANYFEEINGKCIDLDGFHDGVVKVNQCLNRKPASSYPFGHFGIVMNNTNPDMQSSNIQIWKNRIEGMKFGAIFVIGTGHTIHQNTFLHLNTAHCSESGAGCTYFPGEPDLLRSGIYFGRRAERAAVTRGNKIEDNIISGWKMSDRCLGFAPGVDRNEQKAARNRCISEER